MMLSWVRIFLMYCLVLLFSIKFVINKQWALLNVCWINTHSWYLGCIRTHPNIYNRLCIWLAVSQYMNGCAWLRARRSYTIYHSTEFNLSRKITSRLITSTYLVSCCCLTEVGIFGSNKKFTSVYIPKNGEIHASLEVWTYQALPDSHTEGWNE